MPLPDRLAGLLGPETASTWSTLAGVLAHELYLGGGTALTVHLHHRTSHDLDFFYHHGSVDLDALEHDLRRHGALAVSSRAPGTLNAVFNRTRLQFLHADERHPQLLLEEPEEVGGLRVASIRDIAAMKLNVISARGEQRDYYDLQAIERQARYPVEQALGDYLERYQPSDPQALTRTVTALGYLDDVADDPGLPADRAQTAAYWRSRQRALLAATSRYHHLPTPRLTQGSGERPAAPSSAGAVWVPAHTRRGRPVRGHWRKRAAH